MLDLVGLSGEKHRIKGYSRGMKQRLGIAQALLNCPKLLICDEPTSALDPVGRKEILDILQNAKEQTTILFSTHILSDVERICTEIACLNDGKVAFQGKLSDIKEMHSSNDFEVELEREADAKMLSGIFKDGSKQDGTRLIFQGKREEIYSVMNYISDNRIPFVKMEHMEPTLESLFLEVIGK